MKCALFENVNGIALSLALPYKSPIALPPVGAELLVERGTVWLTVSGDSRDIILRAGQSWPVGEAGRIVVEATEPQGAALRLSKAFKPRLAGSGKAGFVRQLVSRLSFVFRQKGWSTAVIPALGRSRFPGTHA